MAEIKGMGACLVPNDEGKPCGRQIAEGEPIGTVMAASGPIVGHRKCADAFHARKQQQERESRNSMVKDIKQAGAGGPLDFAGAKDTIMGSIPLEKSPNSSSDLNELTKAAGIPSIADVPMEDEMPPVEHAKAGNATLGLTPEEMAELDAYKQKLIDSRPKAVSAEDVDQALERVVQVVVALSVAVDALRTAIQGLKGSRDQARSERDAARVAQG